MNFHIFTFINIFSGDRPYKCDTCDKEFNYLTTYKRHLNIHKGEKPFACDHCDKKFTRLNYLKNHLNTHAKHSSQESQTDFQFDDGSSRPSMDVDSQGGLGAMEEETAARSIRNESKSVHGNAAEKAGNEGRRVGDKEQVLIDWHERVCLTNRRQFRMVCTLTGHKMTS